MKDVLAIILTFMFDSTGPMDIAMKLLYIIGLWKLLVKSGVRGWLALVPVVRDYQAARCAMREPEGHIYCMANLSIPILRILLRYLEKSQIGVEDLAASGSTLTTLLVVLAFTTSLVAFIYGARVFAGLINIYGRKKIWILLWLFSFTRWIPALIWGFNDEYKPSMQVQDIKAEMERLATHGSAAVMDEGLTVNLKERCAYDFLHKNTLLRDIHLSIPQGHMVLLLGGSGAGKTTFVNAVNGYEKAKAEIMLNGSNMYTQYSKMQYDIGFVPQADMLRGKDTVISTLTDAAKLRLPKDVDPKLRRSRIEEVMEIFGLTAVQNSLVEKLSGGQRKRLSIAMELISNPSLFILDEPDSGLDGVMARELFGQLRRIADSGKIVIAISHTPDRVIDLFDDVIVLAKDSTGTGRLAWYGSVEEARKFFGREKMEEIVKAVNQKTEGGDGLADEYVMRFAEVQHG